MAARFVDVSEPVIDKFKESAVPQKPNWYAPKFGVKLFKGRLIKFLLQVTQFIENWKSPRINLIFLHFHPVVIKGWSVSALFSHLVGGMKYYNENWLCLPPDGTVFTSTPTIAAQEGSMFMSTVSACPCLNFLGRERAIAVPRTQLVFVTWNLATSSRWFRLTTTVQFTCIPSTPTLARIWF